MPKWIVLWIVLHDITIVQLYKNFVRCFSLTLFALFAPEPKDGGRDFHGQRIWCKHPVFILSETPTWRAGEAMRRPGTSLTNILFCCQPTTSEKTSHWLCGYWWSTSARGNINCIVVMGKNRKTTTCRSPTDELSLTSHNIITWLESPWE